MHWRSQGPFGEVQVYGPHDASSLPLRFRLPVDNSALVYALQAHQSATLQAVCKKCYLQNAADRKTLPGGVVGRLECWRRPFVMRVYRRSSGDGRVAGP